jgi:isopentenyl-diphosphate delta-isomerase
VSFEDGLIEHEIDHVFLGRYQGGFEPNPDEVEACKWEAPGIIESGLRQTPSSFTHWFGIAFKQFGLDRPSRLLEPHDRTKGIQINGS